MTPSSLRLLPPATGERKIIAPGALGGSMSTNFMVVKGTASPVFTSVLYLRTKLMVPDVGYWLELGIEEANMIGPGRLGTSAKFANACACSSSELINAIPTASSNVV